MELLQELLQISAQLYKHLEKLPPDKDRDEYIKQIHQYLDERGSIIEKIQGFEVNPIFGHPLEKQLREFDEGICNRLKKEKDQIAQDMINLQKSKISERRYIDPYSSVRFMDGTYFDRKK